MIGSIRCRIIFRRATTVTMRITSFTSTVAVRRMSQIFWWLVEGQLMATWWWLSCPSDWASFQSLMRPQSSTLVLLVGHCSRETRKFQARPRTVSRQSFLHWTCTQWKNTQAHLAGVRPSRQLKLQKQIRMGWFLKILANLADVRLSRLQKLQRRTKMGLTLAQFLPWLPRVVFTTSRRRLRQHWIRKLLVNYWAQRHPR